MLGRVLAGFINFFTGLVTLFLGLRVLLRLFGANPDAAFVQWVYSSTSGLMQPFRGVFPTETIARDYVLDFSALFALIVYGLVGMALLSLVLHLTPEPAATKKKR